MIKLGTNSIGKIYLGSNSIGKAYLGSNLVFQKGGSPTPPPYTAVDYIENDGVAYIDTGIKGNVTKSVELYVVPVSQSSGNTYIMGCRKDSGSTRFYPFMVSSSEIAGYAYGSGVYNGNTTGISCANSINNQTPMYVRCSLTSTTQKFSIKQDGQSSYTTKTNSLNESITTDINMLFFASLYGENLSIAPAGIRLYSLKIYSDANYTTPLLNGVPCLYEGEYGLWDLVSNTFFGNANSSGTFTGPSNL